MRTRSFALRATMAPSTVGWGRLALASFLCSVATGASAASMMFDHVGASSRPDTPEAPGASAISPDGESLYVLDRGLDRVFVYQRDGSSGDLAFVEHEDGGIGGSGLSTVSAIAVSPDSAHVYVANRDEDSLIVYSRDLGTGALSLVDVEFEDVDGVDGIASSRDILMSSGGEHLYVVGSSSAAVFSRDAATGLLTFIENEVGDASDEAVLSPDGLHLYSTASSDVGVRHRDPTTGELTFDPSLALEFGGSSLNAEELAISPDGMNLYVGVLTGGLFTLSRDPATGGLAVLDDFFGGRLDIAVTPDGTHVYVGSANTLRLFERDAAGLLTHVKDFEEGVDGVHGVRAGSIRFSPGGSHMYVTGAWGVSAIQRDAGSGDLSFVGGFHDFTGAGSGVVSGDGEHAYLAVGVGLLGAFDRDAATGDLTFVEMYADDADGVAGMGVPVDVALSDDGLHLYVAAAGDNAIAAFAREPSTGKLTYLEAEVEGVDGVIGLSDVAAIDLPVDGEHLYAVSRGGEALTVFDRDPTTGLLSFVEADLENLVSGFAGSAVAVSPDGSHVLALTLRSLLSYERDVTTGRLTLVDVKVDGHGGQGLFSGDSLTVSAEGAVYVVGSHSFVPSTLAVYSLDADTGALDFVEVHTSGQGGAFGLGSASEPALAVDESHLLVPGDELSVFRRDRPTGRLALVEIQGLNGNGPAFASPGGEQVYVLGADIAQVFEAGLSCPAVPAVGCRGAEKATVSLVDHPVDVKDSLSWVWKRGEATSAAEFDPGVDNHFLTCGYDESGPTPELVYVALLPAGEDCRKKENAAPRPCWSVSTSKTKMKDRFQTPDGIKVVVLKPGADGASTIKLKGRGFNMTPPPLPLGLPFRLQLQSLAGPCWESVFDIAQKNDSVRFKAKAN